MGGIGNMIQFIINEGWRDRYYHSSSKETSKTSESSSFAGIEQNVSTPPLNLLPRVYTSDEPKFEIKIKIDTSTSINLEDLLENNGKLRPYSTSSTSTKVSNEDSSTIVDINSEVNHKNT
jgi:hypothetical protein